MVPGTIVWLAAFLLFVVRAKWWVAAACVAGTLAVVYGLQLYVGLVLPGSVFVSG
jgi:hypothetical protein